jgi:hypothetical protein
MSLKLQTQKVLDYAKSWKSDEGTIIPIARLNEDVVKQLQLDVSKMSYIGLNSELKGFNYDYVGLRTFDGTSESARLASISDGTIQKKGAGVPRGVENYFGVNTTEATSTIDRIFSCVPGCRKSTLMRLPSLGVLPPHIDNRSGDMVRYNLIVTAGSGAKYFVSGEEFSVESGDFFWLNSSATHAIDNSNKNTNLIIMVIDSFITKPIVEHCDEIQYNLLTEGLLK